VSISSQTQLKDMTYLCIGDVLELSHIWIGVVQVSDESTCSCFNCQAGSVVVFFAVLRSTKAEQTSDNEALNVDHDERNCHERTLRLAANCLGIARAVSFADLALCSHK